jgi:hypothetical protein
MSKTLVLSLISVTSLTIGILLFKKGIIDRNPLKFLGTKNDNVVLNRIIYLSEEIKKRKNELNLIKRNESNTSVQKKEFERKYKKILDDLTKQRKDLKGELVEGVFEVSDVTKKINWELVVLLLVGGDKNPLIFILKLKDSSSQIGEFMFKLKKDEKIFVSFVLTEIDYSFKGEIKSIEKY